MTETPEVKVLLLEDSPSDARLLQQGLKEVQETRFTVTWVECLADAIAKLGERVFDIGLLDLTLPDSAGSATFEKVLEAFPGLPIVVLTGATDETAGTDAIRSGVQDYLVKGSAGGKTMARVIRYAIERKNSERALRRSVERFELLSYTASELLQSKAPLETVESLCIKVMQHLDCHAFFNFLIDENAGRLHLNACAGVPEEEIKKIEWLDFGVAVCGCVAQEGVRIVAEHIPATPDLRTELIKSFGIKAYACHPLPGESGRTLGTLSFGTRSRETFSEEDLSFMKAVADQVAIAMVRQKIEEDLRTSRAAALNLMDDALEAKKQVEHINRTLKALSASSRALSHADNEKDYIGEVCRIVREDCGHAMVWIGFAEDDEEKTVRPAAYAGFEQGYLETLKLTWADTDLGRGPTGTAIRTGKISECKDMLNDPAFAPWRAEALKRGYSSSVVFPLVSPAGGRSFGALNIYNRQPDAFSADEVKLLSDLANDLAFGIRTIRLRTDQVESRKKIEELNTFLKIRAVELSSSYTELQRLTQLLSQDLRVPLRVISGYSHLLLDEYHDKIDASGSKYITSLDNGVQQVNALLDDILLLSSISRKQMWLQRVNLSVLAKEVVEDLRKSEPAYKAEIIIRENVLEWADRGFMKQLLQNLLENAWKFTHHRDKPKIEFGTVDGQKPQVCFVRDNGTGFDIQDAQKLFTPFHRLAPDNDFATAGAGLAIVERIIQRHGGRVWAEGEKDKGAVFYFKLG